MAGTLPAKMVGTFGPLVDRYEKEMWPVKRWGTSKSNELSVLRRDLGNRLLSDFSQSMVLTYVKGLNISPGGVSTRLSYLREVLKTGRALWGARVPVEEVSAAISSAKKMKLAGASQARVRRPTKEELETIIAYAKGQTRSMIDLGPIVNVLATVPLRLSELLGIKWGDLNKAKRSAVIRSRKHPDIRVKEANSQEVPLISYGGIDTFALIAGRPDYLPSPFPYQAPSVSAAFHFAALRCQILDLHLHDLRAHAMSTLLEAGIPIPLVALMSGHRNWKVLAKHYARIDPSSVHEAVKRLT